MRSEWNEKTHRREWIIDRWYHKWVFVIGWIWTGLFLLGAVVGFLEALTY